MLRSVKDLEGYAIAAIDGAVGHVKDFYFDDDAWVVRYLVVEAGAWLKRRKVLVSPIAIGAADWTQRSLPAAITMQQVKDSPGIDTDKPVSRQHEVEYLGYYGYPYYWGGIGIWGGDMTPNTLLPGYDGFASSLADRTAAEAEYAKAVQQRHRHDDPHLRSCNAVIGYHIDATDGDIGHVQGMLVDDETWAVRYVVIDTSNWWLGHRVLVSPEWIREVRWGDNKVAVDLTRRALRDAPAYDATLPFDRALEESLYEHYGRTGYWQPMRVPQQATQSVRSGWRPSR